MLAWACWLISYTVVKFFEQIDQVGTAGASIIIAVIGILATVIGFYQYHRGTDRDR